MLAGLVLISIFVGALATALAWVLALPLWITLAAYPTIGSCAILIAAGLWALRDGGGTAAAVAIKAPVDARSH